MQGAPNLCSRKAFRNGVSIPANSRRMLPESSTSFPSGCLFTPASAVYPLSIQTNARFDACVTQFSRTSATQAHLVRLRRFSHSLNGKVIHNIVSGVYELSPDGHDNLALSKRWIREIYEVLSFSRCNADALVAYNVCELTRSRWVNSALRK